LTTEIGNWYSGTTLSLRTSARMVLKAMVKHIELWLLDKLIPFARNPRTHSDEQVAQIAASIEEFGFNNPILVDTKAGIIAGHGRLLAARKLELTEVPVIVLDHLTEAQKRAYIIADNRLALNAGWDEALLREELAALQQEDFNIDLIGFDDAELARLLAAQEAIDGLTDEDAVPALPETPVSRAGDLWILGDHQLLVGDATDSDHVARLMGNETADLVFTDPPYNVDYEGYTEEHLKIKGDRMSTRSSKNFSRRLSARAARLSNPAPRFTCATHLPGNVNSLRARGPCHRGAESFQHLPDLRRRPELPASEG
jgi:ParB-like chromosome segregation protein Spo0J